MEKKERRKRRFIKNDTENDKQQIMFQQNDIFSKPYFLVFHLYRRKRQFNDTSVNLGRRSAKTYFTKRSILGGVSSLRSSPEKVTWF